MSVFSSFVKSVTPNISNNLLQIYASSERRAKDIHRFLLRTPIDNAALRFLVTRSIGC